MKNKRKNGFKRVLFICITVYFGYILFKQQLFLNQCSTQKAYYNNEIKKAKTINVALQEQEKTYSTDEFVEKMAREKLGMVYPEEKIFKDITQ